MNLGQDLRYVTEEDFMSFGGRQQRKEAWDVKTGWLGKMIFRNFNITYIHNGHTVFSHGDMEPEWAKLGVDTLNHLAQEAIWNSNFNAPIFRGTGKSCLPFWFGHKKKKKMGAEKDCVQSKLLIHSSVLYGPCICFVLGPIWSRDHAMGEGGMAATCRRIEQVKKALGVK